MRAGTCAQQGQCNLKAIAVGEQVDAHDAFKQCRVKLLRVDIFTGAGIQNHRVQRAPVLCDAHADFAHLLMVAQVAGHNHDLPRIAFGKIPERFHRACGQGQSSAALEQRLGHVRANSAAGTCQPDSA